MFSGATSTSLAYRVKIDPTVILRLLKYTGSPLCIDIERREQQVPQNDRKYTFDCSSSNKSHRSSGLSLKSDGTSLVTAAKSLLLAERFKTCRREKGPDCISGIPEKLQLSIFRAFAALPKSLHRGSRGPNLCSMLPVSIPLIASMVEWSSGSTSDRFRPYVMEKKDCNLTNR